MSVKKIYKNRIMSSRYLFADGHEAAFVAGKYYTDITGEIEELNAEILKGHPHLYVDPADAEIDTDNLDPFAEIKRQAVEQYIADQAAASSQANDRGTTAQVAVTPASSATVAVGAADSNSIAKK